MEADTKRRENEQRDHYSKNATNYVTSRLRSAGYQHFMHRWQGELTRPIRDKYSSSELRELVILDPMCGHGNLAEFILRLTDKLILNDLSAEMLSRIPENISSKCTVLTPRSVCNLDLPESSVDIVIVSGGLHHVYYDVDAALSEIQRVLRPGGMLIFGEPSNDFFIIRLMRNFIYRINSAFHSETERAFHAVELTGSLERAGFEDISIRPFGSVGYLLLGQVGVIGILRFLKNEKVFSLLQAFDEFIERNSILRKSCFAFIGSATKKPISAVNSH